MLPNKKTTQGFTFVEVIISVALLALVGLLITNILLNTVRGILKAEAVKNVKQSGEVAMTVLTHRLRNSKSITICTTGMNTIEFDNSDDTTTLVYVAEDPPSSGVRKIFADTDGVLEVLTENNSVTVDLTDDLLFDCDPSSGRIDLSFKLVHVSSGNTPFEDRAESMFMTTVVKREY